MEQNSKQYTPLDHFLVNDLTTLIPKTQNKFNRAIFRCNIDKVNKCDFLIMSQGTTEYQRLFKHFQKTHCLLLSNLLIKYLIDHPSTNETLSSILFINDYIKIHIFPMYEAEKQKTKSITINFSNKSGAEHLLDVSNIDITKLNQSILEQGIFEHLPIKVICSKAHSTFLSGLMMYGYEIGRYTDLTPSQFSKICSGTAVPRKLLQKVGNDYFVAGISPFKGGYSSFQIDASKVNNNEILVFVLSKNNFQKTFLFDIQQNFQGDLISYRDIVREKILKASELGINIVGLTTDCLPVQIQALSHDSNDSIQKKYPDMTKIIHFRCIAHLLNSAYREWIKSKNILSEYENKIKSIVKVLNLKPFTKKLSKKIPTMCVTRWTSAFKVLETIFYLRKEIISLFQKANKKEIKLLLKIKNDIKFIFSIGFLQVYPLLFYFSSLMEYVQEEHLSCVDAIIVVEHFLSKIKKNIEMYQIHESGKDLYKLIKKKIDIK